MQKKAVVLLNLGGPDSPDAVQPFLFNLFYDKRIINLPNPFRYLLARYISWKRTPVAKEIYHHLGGSSPILKETQAQAASLQSVLGEQYEVFVVMRYWHPFASEVLPRINSSLFSEIILLPLYPQFSTATSLSSIEECKAMALVPSKYICCYYMHPLFIEAHSDLIAPVYAKASDIGKPVVLFSAHGLPVSLIKKGDPYSFQVESCVAAIVNKLNIDNLDWEICYQSKVGRKRWLEPDTVSLLEKYNDRPVVVVPIAFVSEHSETLVELDIEYSGIAKNFFRVPTLSSNEKFIACLADLVENGCQYTTVCPEDRKMCIRRSRTLSSLFQHK